jgi:phosphoesterase RecJ-like protein
LTPFARRLCWTSFFYVFICMSTNGVPIPPDRARAAQEVAAVLTPGRRVVLTTHVNADGDGVGSEIGLWHLLKARGVTATIANPTGIPERFDFLIPDGADVSDRAVREVERADVIVVLDIGDLSRLGDLGHAVQQRGAPTVCIDHHISPGSLPAGPRLVAPEATATAELVFDLAGALGWPLSPESARALYVGILTDTGGFRFSNTSARALRVAAALLEQGVDPEGIYEAVYASAPEGRVRLTAEVLQTLVVEPEAGLAWVTVPPDALDRHGATADDLDGIVEFPRSIAGVRLALLFRQIANGRIKVSFRSMGAVDVADLAHQFGGGGHKKAAGASFEGTMADVETKVLAAARAYLKDHGERRAAKR